MVKEAIKKKSISHKQTSIYSSTPTYFYHQENIFLVFFASRPKAVTAEFHVFKQHFPALH